MRPQSWIVGVSPGRPISVFGVHQAEQAAPEALAVLRYTCNRPRFVPTVRHSAQPSEIIPMPIENLPSDEPTLGRQLN
jgi:hypothetical protein